MRIFVFFLAFIVGLVGLASANICAGDERNPGGLQHFPSIEAMIEENERGGRK